MEAAEGAGRSMSGKEDLDPRFIEHQRARLEDMRRMLLRAHAGIEAEEREWSESSQYAHPDAEDVAARILAGEVDTALDQTIMRRLGLIQRALEKIDEGSYGVCDDTGEPISRGRLEAAPEAIYTIEAQKARERTRG